VSSIGICCSIVSPSILRVSVVGIVLSLVSILAMQLCFRQI